MAKENPEDLESVRVMDNSITSSGDRSGCVTITAKESENIVVELLDDLDSYMQDINDRLTISRMVSDSVIKGMVGAVEQEAADRISQKESEIVRLKEKLLYHNNVFAAENGVLECPMHTSMEGSASTRSNLFPSVKSPEHDRIRDFLMGYKTEAWKQLTEIKDRIHSFRQRNSIDCSNSGLKLALSFDSASTTPLEKVPERFSDIEGAVDCLQITLNSLFNHFSDMVHFSRSSFFEWQQEREFQAEVEAMIIAIYFRYLQEEFEGMLWDENSKVGVVGSVNFLKKMKGELSSLHQELDGLNRLLSVPDAGHIASLGSVENGEEYGNGGSSKVTDHLHRKLSGSHVFSSSSSWETSGKDEELTIAMPENIDNAKLVHMTKEDLVDHFKTEMIKMKRYHESKVQEMTEEYFRLKREYLRERGSSLPLKKDKDFDELKRKIPEVVLKLDEVLVESERFLSLNGDVERLSKMKERLDVLLSENSHLKNMLAEKKREIEHLCSEVYDAREKISCYSQSEANLLVVIENLEREKEEKRIKSTICGEVYQCFLTVLPTHVHCITDNLCMESDPRKASCEVSCREAISDGRDSRDSEIENLYMDSVISQELSELVFSKALREAEEKFDCLSNECLNEKFLRVYLEQEVLEQAEFLKFEAAEKQKLKEEILQLAASLEEKGRLAKETGDQLPKEKKLFDQAPQELERLRDETWQQGMLIAEINKETEELKSDLDQALEKIEMYKEDSCKLNQKLDFAMAELNQKEMERKLLLLAVLERQGKLLLAEASEKLYKKQMESITEVAQGVMKSLADFESRAAVDLERNLSRLGVLGSEMKSLTQDKILKRWGLTYKKRLEKKCQEFEKAEKEVDLLGDKVDYLSDLLEKIYIALDHYSPILKHYPGVMETLELVKGELSRGSVKSV